MSVEESGSLQGLASPMRHFLFRTVKELVNNAAKHGPATEIMVGVHWRDGGVRVVVDDDGHGFDAAQALTPRTPRSGPRLDSGAGAIPRRRHGGRIGR